MVKKNWSNPELKELSIEYTQATKLICNICGKEAYQPETKKGDTCSYQVPGNYCYGVFVEKIDTDFIS